MFTPTPEQIAVVERAKSTTDNILLSALAGAAKTSTLVLIAEALPNLQILTLAFNKRIAVEMQERLPSNCQAMTLNSLGHRTWSEATGRRLRIEAGKTYQIVKELVDHSHVKDTFYENFAELMRIVDFGKSCGYIPSGHYEKAKRLMDDDQFFNHIEQKLNSLEIELIREATLLSLKQAFEGLCDYNDQILMPTVFHGAFPRYPLTLVDEAQDLSALNHATLRKMIGTRRLIAVGDSCQPAGTLITIVEKLGDRWNRPKLKKVPIEELNEGAILLGYNGIGAFIFNRTLLNKTERNFNGRLITVKMKAGEKSTYTEDHHCYASFEPFRKYYALYLMRKGDKFRIGRCKMEYEGVGSGPTTRAFAEKADAYWLLGLYETERETAVEEAVVQAEFGIPDITFRCPNTNIGFADQAYLDEAWSYILASVDLKERAEKCLTKYRKLIKFPIWQNGFPAKFSLLRPSIIQACNLVPGCLMLPYNGESKILRTDWEPVEISGKSVENFPVYSLSVSDNQLYIADNIVTHNCQAIYSFRGAHEHSMGALKREFNMVEMHLSISFRCPISIVEHSHWRAPTMRWPDWAKRGSVTFLDKWTPDDLPESATIICRNNAPLFRIAIKLLIAGRPVELHGKDVVAGLTKIMRKFGGSDLRNVDVLDKIDVWEEQQKAKNKHRAHGSIEDRAECMRIFAGQGQTLGDALAYAQHMVSLHSSLVMLTGHKAKGLEFDNVFFLDEELIGITEQEPNLRYVIITRAKETLTYINSENYVQQVKRKELANV